MLYFRIMLAVLTVNIIVYTSFVGLEHGWNLLPVFFNDIVAMTWPGQFNMDFMSFLLLSGLWTMWRHHFSGAGIALGILAFFGGILFLAPYLLIASMQAKGHVPALLLGPARVSVPEA